MKRILVVVDMQNDFLTGTLGSKEAEQVIQSVVDKINKYKNENGTVILTRDTHDSHYLDTQEGKFLPVMHCIKDTMGWEIADQIKEVIDNNMMIIDKPTFGSMELASEIKNISENESVEVELVGVCTDICVVSNALILKAVLPEVVVKVDATCCAGVTYSKHKSALETLKSCQVTIINE